MNLFFMISGFLFVSGFSVILNYLFEIFSINKFTKFLNPLNNAIFNDISYSIIPNIIWAFIELIILGSNYYFLLGFVLNILVSMGVMYVIRYGYKLVLNEENHIVNVVSILVSCLFGFTCNYLFLLTGVNKNISTWFSLIGLIIFTGIYLVIKFFPPKSDFFRGTSID